MVDQDKYYIFFDGECGFCNQTIAWILKRDKKDQFLFASLQSDLGQKFLSDRNLATNNFQTLYLWKPNAYYLTKTAATMQILKLLGGKYKILSHLNILPEALSDRLYSLLARNRKSISANNCYVPTEEERKKIIK